MSQMESASWSVQASRALNQGRLIISPAIKRLERQQNTPQNGPNGTVKEGARILDFGGRPDCDWAWQVACEFPNAKVYTTVTKSRERER